MCIRDSAHHVENVRPYHRRLADHSNARRLLREDECLHLVVLLDYARISRPGGERHCHSCVQGGNSVCLLIEARDEFRLGRGLQLGGRAGGFDNRRVTHGAARHKPGCKSHRNYGEKSMKLPLESSYGHQQKNLAAAPRSVNEWGA